MQKIMVLCVYAIVLVFLEGIYGINVYKTPASDMQFDNFEITNRVPEHGSTAGGNLQDQVQIEGNHVIFQFKGLGNALILFCRETAEGPLSDGFLVEIGGGIRYSEVSIYKSTEKDDLLCERRIPNITSVTEYRYFWISWIAREIHVGTGNTLHENEIISANETVLKSHNVYLSYIVAISISTTSSNSGFWRFNIPATGISTAFFQRSSISMDVSVTDAPKPLLASQASSLKKKSHILTSNFVPSANASTDSKTLLYGQSSTASNKASITIPLTRRTDFLFEISFSKSASTGVLDLLTVDGQTFGEIALITHPSVSTELLTSTLAAVTKQGSLQTVTILSQLSDNLSTLPSSIYMKISTDKDNDVNHKWFLDSPENVAVIGLLTGAGGIGSLCIVGYLMKKRCKNVSVTSGGSVDVEEYSRDSEENIAY